MVHVRKAFNFLPEEETVTHVYDAVSATIPDQSLTLRELLMKFAYIGEDRLQELVNRGWDDEDDDVLGVDVGSLDFAEVHDRVIELVQKQRDLRALHAPVEDPVPVEDPAPVDAEQKEQRD